VYFRFCLSSGILKKTAFRKLGLFLSSERTKLTLFKWTPRRRCLPLSHLRTETIQFPKHLLWHTRRWTISKNPVIPRTTSVSYSMPPPKFRPLWSDKVKSRNYEALYYGISVHLILLHLSCQDTEDKLLACSQRNVTEMGPFGFTMSVRRQKLQNRWNYSHGVWRTVF
jgi:hypothetical protein